MFGNEYHFVTHWRVEGEKQEVFDVIANASGLSRWWPSVYLDVQEVGKGGKDGEGKIISLKTKGWLPYTLRWQFRVLENDPPNGFALEAWGDFVGSGVWSFTQDGPWTDIVYDWRIRAEKPLLRHLSFLMKPFFAANHRWAMDKGEESLRLELARRRAKTEEERKLIPFPPPPNKTSALWLLSGTAAIVGALYFIQRSRRARSK